MRFQSLILLACVVGALSIEWDAWRERYGKVYRNKNEEARRLSIWRRNLEIVVKHNLKYELGESSFELEMNKFADLEDEEFVAMMNGYRGNTTSKASEPSTFLMPSNVELPKKVDWRKKGYVTPIKNQGECGSCWAFSATGSLEGQHFKKAGKLVSLSEQNLVDCSRKEGNMGCSGGLMDQAFQYVIDNHGIDTEQSYPYTGQDGTCHYNKKTEGSTCTGFTDVKHDDEEALQQAIATVGPISVAIDASRPTFRMYKKGVYDDPSCSSTRLDHGVLAVGYGTDKSEANKKADYYIVKNSWGTDWGNEGYIWMSRNKNNQCGIATEASYPLV